MASSNIPEKTIERLSEYRRTLLSCHKQGITHIFSHVLAGIHGITAVQVRRDLMLIGFSSDTKKGYDVKVLIDFISNILDSDTVTNIAVIGMGHLGQAITKYFNGRGLKLKITTAFDIDPAKVGQTIDGIPCHHMETFEEVVEDKDIDIVCSVGGGTHTKSVNRRATSVYDASVQLCAELNNANHGTVRLRFGVDGDWLVSAGNCINQAGYGKLDGKYFVDKVTHKVSASGLTTDFECSGIGTAFHYWDVGGKIEYLEPEEDSGVDYDSAYATTSPAANAASSAAGAEAGASVALTNAPFYVASTSASPACHKSGTYYFYDGILINGRYRMTNTAARCGKLPVGKNVTGWVPASYCIAGKEG